LYTYDPRCSSWLPRINVNSKHIPFPFDVASLSVLTWNIDFTAPHPVIRLQTLLRHLEQLLSPLLNSPPPPYTIILLQEVHQSCFPALLAHTFIRTMYDTTDISPSSWSGGSFYGTVTLVPKSLAVHVSSVFRTPFTNSGMDRDALYVDVDLPSQAPASDTKIKVRIANTHLESLGGHGDGARPVQLGSIAKLLACSDVRGGLVGGDMNAISPSDVDLPGRVGLVDPWDELAPTDDVDGHTWGYQPRSVYPPNRLDKILLRGDLRAEEVKKVGIGLKAAGLGEWVSDHCGLLARVVVG